MLNLGIGIKKRTADLSIVRSLRVLVLHKICNNHDSAKYSIDFHILNKLLSYFFDLYRSPVLLFKPTVPTKRYSLLKD